MLREVLRQRLQDVVAGPFRDPNTVAGLFEAGVGATVTVVAGGKTDMPSIGLKGQPLRLTGVVDRLTDGEYVATGPMFTGMQLSLGRTTVLRVGTVLVFVGERLQQPFDVGIFKHAGIDPAQRRYVLIKCR